MKNVQINKIPFLVGLGVFVVALGLRLIGIGWGLPSEDKYFSYHPDEDFIQQVSEQVKPFQGKMAPGFYNYGTLYLSVLSVASDIVDTYSGATAEELKARSPEVRKNRMLAGRVISSLAGALAALAVYLTLIRHTHWVGGLMGGLAVGLTPGLVVHSRFQTVDVLAMMFLAWCFYQCSRMFPGEDGEEVPAALMMKAAIWAGVFAGLSAGTKYTGVLAFAAIGVCLAMALGMSRIGDIAKIKLASFAVMMVVFVAVTPGIATDTAKFMQDFQYEIAHTSTGHGLVFAGTAPGWIYHVSNLVVGYGGLLFLMSLAGLGRGCWRRHGWLIGPTVFMILIYVLIGRAEVKFLRYVFPMIPVLGMGFGWAMGQAHKNGSMKAKAVVALGIASLGGFGGGLASTVNMTRWMTQPDPRQEMAEFVFEHLPEGASIGIVKDPWFYSPNLHPLIQAGPAQIPIERRLEFLAQVPGHPVIRFVPEDINARQDWDVRLLTISQPDYVIFSSFEYEGLEVLDGAGRGSEEFGVQLAQYQEFLTELKASYDRIPVVLANGQRAPWVGGEGLAFTARIHDLAYIRPQLWIWKRKDSTTGSSGTSMPSNSSEEPASTPLPPTDATSNSPPNSSESGDGWGGTN